jgi:hypothetical protein
LVEAVYLTQFEDFAGFQLEFVEQFTENGVAARSEFASNIKVTIPEPLLRKSIEKKRKDNDRCILGENTCFNLPPI